MATIIRQMRSLTFTTTATADGTVLDGSAAGLTYQAKDRLASACVRLDEETDSVTITIDGTGADGNTAAFNIYGYGENGPAERIYHTVTATLGTAVAGTGKCYAEEIAGTDVHTGVIGIQDRELNSNSMAKFTFDTRGLRYLYFEPITFTTLTAMTFHIREWGTK